MLRVIAFANKLLFYIQDKDNAATSYQDDDTNASSAETIQQKLSQIDEIGDVIPSLTDHLEEQLNTNNVIEASEVTEVSLPLQECKKSTQMDDAIMSNVENSEIMTVETEEKKTDLDAELVSEDELPLPQKELVLDAVEVSDDELPGPIEAELPADAEEVSEDEIATKNPDSQNLKRKLSQGDNDEDINDQRTKITKNQTELNRKLPELDKYWKAVNDDVTDFTAWTYLLQYVDHEVNDVI